MMRQPRGAWIRCIGIAILLTCSMTAMLRAEVPNWPYELSDLLPDPAVRHGTLPNGFRYMLMKNSTPKNRVNIHLLVHVGSVHETDSEQGVAHFLEHLMFCGSTHFKPGELTQYFQRIGMDFGNDANAHTGYFDTVYDIILPNQSKKMLEEGLTVIKDYAQGALLLKSEIDRERKVVLAEQITRDSASYRTFVSVLNFELPQTRISRRHPIGTEDVLKTVDRKRLKAFYDRWYRPERMTLVMVGDMDERMAISLIQKQFSSLTARSPAEPDPAMEPVAHTGIKPFYHYEQEAGSTRISIEVIRKNRYAGDSVARQKEELISDMANRIVKDRLDKRLRKPDTPFTSAAIWAGEYFNYFETAEISAECAPENWRKTLAAVEQTLRTALTFGFMQPEIERVKKDFLADLEKEVEKASTRESRDVANQLLNSISDQRVFQSPQQRKDMLAPIIESVTPEILHEAFKRNWAVDHRLILLTGNADLRGSEKTPEAQILDAYNQSSAIETVKPTEVKSAVFPYLAEPEAKGRITQRDDMADLGIIRIDFDNGVRLNLKKTDFEANTVKAALSFGKGKLSEPDGKPGLKVLTESVINESGLGALDKEELDMALAGKKTSVMFAVGEDRFVFQGSSVPQELPLLFQLLYAHLTDTGFREDAYQLSLERIRQTFESFSKSMEGVMNIYGNRFLSGGSRNFGYPMYEDVKRLTLDDIRSWIEPSLKSDPIELSVVGDFNPDTVMDLAVRYLGSLERKSVHQADNFVFPKFPVNQSTTLSVATKIEKGMVVIAYPTDDIWDIQRTRRLSVLASVVSNRLHEQIREKLGAAYSSYAFNHPSRAYPGYGAFKTVIILHPDQTELVVEKVKALISDMAKNGVSPDELKRATDPILTQIKDLVQTNAYWLNTVLDGSKEHPQQIDWSRTIISDHQAITVADVSNLAAHYLDNQKAAVIVIKPEGSQPTSQNRSCSVNSDGCRRR